MAQFLMNRLSSPGKEVDVFYLEEGKLQPIKARDPDEEKRLEQMLGYLQKRSYVCLCQLLLLFHIDKENALRVLNRLVSEGKLNKSKTWAGEPIYVTTRDIRNDEELVEISADIEFAVGILEEAFAGFRRGIPLNDQGPIGSQIRSVLTGTVIFLSEVKLVPDYWHKVRFNSTAIILALRHVFPGNRLEIKSFLRLMLDMPRGIGGAAVDFLRDTDILFKSVQQAYNWLHTSNREIKTILNRL